MVIHCEGLFKNCSAFRKWKLGYIPALQDQNVEGIVVNPRLCRAKVLKQVEIRPAFIVEGYQFPIDTVFAGSRFNASAM